MNEQTNLEIHEQLATLVKAAMPVLGDGGGALPTASPVAGLSRAAWLQQVAMIRSRHDSAALDAGAFLEGILQQAFGPDPLAIGEKPITISWAEVAVAGGYIGLRIYRPAAAASLPIISLIHGGAYWMGGGAAGWQLNDGLCRKLANEVAAVVVNIDHRLAPEFPYPTPLNDVVAALEWVQANAAELGGDAARMAIFGISSGGNLAAAAAGRFLAGKAPRLAAMVLQCPSLNLSLASSRFRNDPNLVVDAQRIIDFYVGDADPNDPDISPGLRPQLAGMPPTLVVTAEFDPLTADALCYVEQLQAAGVAVTHLNYPMTHTVATPEVFRQVQQETVDWIGQAMR